ncbi:MAG TPA: accessory factor UbiK family protein [Hellea balneolensis]|uniref:Accessory factor UbiK family protein n=1 Tax=Hellea balneolensis TaxID=287478 RepID=A0A7C5QQF8_9PROT|nr:accessory factor UbiK family protein [Hellea balneolensis]
MQTKSPAFEDLANLMTNAFGAAKGVGDEVRAAARARAERVIADMDLVGRDEFEVTKLMLQNALKEIETLKAEVKSLKSKSKPKPRARKTSAKT